MKSIYHSNKSQRPDIMMTPMIDVVFLLLIFFLATASFDRVEQILPSGVSEAPQAVSGTATTQTETLPVKEVDEIIVRLENNGSGQLRIVLNDSPQTDLRQLVAQLSQIIKIRNDVPVIIDPANDLPTNEVIAVYDAVRAVGFTSLFLTAK